MSVIAACGIEQTATSVIETPAATPRPTSTHTPIPPTETPIPMVVIVNGEGITRVDFESELNRFLTAQVNEAIVDRQAAETIVLNDIISRTLLVQGANEYEFEISEELINSRVDDLIIESGGEAAFNQWLAANGYSLDTFLVELERSIMVAWMRDQILEEVPWSARQVYLRQIFMLNGEQANMVYGELESGRDFATLADEYDPVTGGELGWVPRNFLPHKEIEEVAFNLQPGEYSQVIETSVGYHIIQVVAIEDERRLSPDARLIWQELALRDWVSLRREVSNIEILALE
jgi:peptidyl-prolyl cis-trans isomerase C